MLTTNWDRFAEVKELRHKARWENRSSGKYWKTRRKVFKRDNYKCLDCGTSEKLILHHLLLWKDNRALRFDPNNCVTLCPSCHSKKHYWMALGKNRKKPIKTILRKNRIIEQT